MASRPHPFADLIDLAVTPDGKGGSTAALIAEHKHMNPHGVVHGAVIYAMADTGMGAALYPTLEPARPAQRLKSRSAISARSPAAKSIVRRRSTTRAVASRT